MPPAPAAPRSGACSSLDRPMGSKSVPLGPVGTASALGHRPGGVLAIQAFNRDVAAARGLARCQRSHSWHGGAHRASLDGLMGPLLVLPLPPRRVPVAADFRTRLGAAAGLGFLMGPRPRASAPPDDPACAVASAVSHGARLEAARRAAAGTLGPGADRWRAVSARVHREPRPATVYRIPARVHSRFSWPEPSSGSTRRSFPASSPGLAVVVQSPARACTAPPARPPRVPGTSTGPRPRCRCACPASTPLTAGTHLKDARVCPPRCAHLLLLTPPPNFQV